MLLLLYGQGVQESSENTAAFREQSLQRGSKNSKSREIAKGLSAADGRRATCHHQRGCGDEPEVVSSIIGCPLVSAEKRGRN